MKTPELLKEFVRIQLFLKNQAYFRSLIRQSANFKIRLILRYSAEMSVSWQ